MKNLLKKEDGFTLIETIIVIVILSITTMAVIPRMTSYFSNKRENFAVATGYLARTFDDAYLNNKINYLVIHLYDPGTAADEEENENRASLLGRNNAFSVLNVVEGTFVLNERKILKPREFSESFRLDKVILADGREFTMGNVLVPYYPQGYSNDLLIHVTANDDERWTIKIRKYFKEPEVVEDHIVNKEL